MTGRYIWKNRLKAPVCSGLWFKLWAKRAWTFHQLIALLLKRARYQIGGVRLGVLADMSGVRLQGPWENLQLGSGSFVGMAEIQAHASVSIGSNVVVNDGVRLLTGTHLVDSPSFEQINRPIVIEDFAWICTGAMVLPGVRIGKGAVVAAGAVVSKDVGPLSVVAGNPARLVRQRADHEFSYRPNLLRACYEAWLGADRTV
jgi:acetyltransferase-like isoleucine patch superfamily enzyme